MIAVADILAPAWRRVLTPGVPVIAGLDIGTTEGKRSNPSALVLTQQVDGIYHVRLALRWKTSDNHIMDAIVDRGLDTQVCPVKALLIDATSERFYAGALRRRLTGRVRVVPVVFGESVTVRGEKMTVKAYVCNLVVNAFEDGRIAIPPDEWYAKDLRSMQRARGTFEAEVAEDGSHADGFIATGLSLYGFQPRFGRAEMSATRVGVNPCGQIQAKPRFSWRRPKRHGRSKEHMPC